VSLAIRRKLCDENETYFSNLSLIFQMGKMYKLTYVDFRGIVG